MKKNGFSFVEVIVVVAIAGILLAGSVVSLANLRTSSNLSTAGDTVRIILQKARLSSLVKEDGSGYSLKFNETNLVLFKGSVYNSAGADNKIINLPSGVRVSAINLSDGGSIVSFSNLSGTTTPGSIVLSAVNDPAKTKTIYINGSGKISPPVVASSGGGSGGSGISQTVDTGHQDLNLGWSIQTTSELKLRFLTDPPQTGIFIMEPHFNGDRSVFNYIGYFSAGGLTQKVRIYSNHLDSNNTILSITREPNDVSLPLEISIDGRVIVTYLGDGTMSVGAFGGTVIGQ